MAWRRGLFAVGVALGLLLGAVACTPSGETCAQAHAAHVTIRGCP